MMALTLSSADLARYRTALTTLLSPLETPSVDGWRARSLECVKKLLGADTGVFMLPLAGHELTHSDCEDMAVGAKAYVEHYHRFDVGLQVRRRELGLEVFSCGMLYDPTTLHRTTIMNEWAIPYRLLDPIGMGFEVNGGFRLASLHMYHQRRSDRPFGETGVELLRLLIPAFKVGVLTTLKLERHRSNLASAIDALSLGILLANIDGGIMHQNPALGEMLANDPERGKLRVAIHKVAQDAAANAPAKASAGHPGSKPRFLVGVRTARAGYRIRGCLVGGALCHDRVEVMVMVDRLAAGLPAAGGLQERHGLTAREVQVASLIGEGRATTDVATLLGISRHTARRHTEHILQKLGVHARAAVRAKLCDPTV